MNNSPTIVSDDDPAAALLKCLQAQLSSSPQSSSKERKSTEHQSLWLNMKMFLKR